MPPPPDAHPPIVPALVVLAAGLSTRYGRLKQLDPVGPEGQALMDYTIADAVEAGVGRVVVVVRAEIEEEVRAHVGAQLARRGLGGGVEVAMAVQRLDDLPAGHRCPADRTHPWGTAHALYAARDALEGVGAFVLVNVDDGYGRDALERIVAWAASGPPEDEFALVPFRLDATLSEHGGVSRGVVEADRAGWLTRIREAVEVRAACRSEALGRWATEDEVAGTPARLPPDTPVSLNLWGFTPRMLHLVGGGLGDFLRRAGGSPGAEYFIPDVVQRGVRGGEARVRVLEPATTHLGMTHPRDRDRVVAELARHRDQRQRRR